MIIQIGSYIREELSPKVPGGLGWEELRRKQRSANDRNRLQPPRRLLVSPLPAIFLAISVVALAWVAIYILFAHDLSVLSRSLLGILWILGLALTVTSFISARRMTTDL